MIVITEVTVRHAIAIGFMFRAFRLRLHRNVVSPSLPAALFAPAFFPSQVYLRTLENMIFLLYLCGGSARELKSLVDRTVYVSE